jgi:hypothetical protein
MRVLAAVVVLVLIVACQAPPTEMTRADREEVGYAALAWSDQWLEAAGNLDAESVAALMHPEDAHAVQGGNDYRSTPADVLAGRREMNERLQVWEPSWDGRRVDVLGPDVALVTGQVTGTLVAADGTRIDTRNRLAFVVQLVDGEWKGLYAHVS